MPTLAYPVANVVQRLDAVEAIKIVGLAVDLQAAISTPPRITPAVFIVASTQGGAIKFAGQPIQQERETSLVLIVWARSQGDAAAARTALDEVLGAIDARLAGYSPANPPFGELRFVAARDEFAQAGYLVAQAIYSSSWNFSAMRQST